ncbi:MAG: DUF2188 domain-containing protein [Verrucomicrobiales bacterium]|nr:DUF2188 domain-containing protein [Verrucomicrobiales bacterium]
MSSKHVYHVLRREDNSWLVLKEGFRRPHLVSSSKERAILLAKRLAKLSLSAQVVVHNGNDLVEREYRFAREAA